MFNKAQATHMQIFKLYHIIWGCAWKWGTPPKNGIVIGRIMIIHWFFGGALFSGKPMQVRSHKIIFQSHGFQLQILLSRRRIIFSCATSSRRQCRHRSWCSIHGEVNVRVLSVINRWSIKLPVVGQIQILFGGDILRCLPLLSSSAHSLSSSSGLISGWSQHEPSPILPELGCTWSHHRVHSWVYCTCGCHFRSSQALNWTNATEPCVAVVARPEDCNTCSFGLDSCRWGLRGDPVAAAVELATYCGPCWLRCQVALARARSGAKIETAAVKVRKPWIGSDPDKTLYLCIHESWIVMIQPIYT